MAIVTISENPKTIKCKQVLEKLKNLALIGNFLKKQEDNFEKILRKFLGHSEIILYRLLKNFSEILGRFRTYLN